MSAAFLVKTTRTRAQGSRTSRFGNVAAIPMAGQKESLAADREETNQYFSALNAAGTLLGLLLYIELSNEKLKLLLKQIRKSGLAKIEE